MIPVLVFLALGQAPQVEVRWIDDEARAVIQALVDCGSNSLDFDKIVASEGFRRLSARERAIGRPITNDDFSQFLKHSPATASQFQETLDGWAKLDFSALGQRAMEYLPAEAHIRASVYPLIKPLKNSFVWDVSTKPAIMLYLDPQKRPDEVAMTVTHELHHIGYASCCPSSSFTAWSKNLNLGQQEAWKWVGAFGEGYAVLAAATDRNNPVGPSSPAVREAWADGMKNLPRDFASLEEFFQRTCEAKLTPKQAQEEASKFYGLQGPWYTVGYVLATTIEDQMGRKVLIDCYTNPRKLFATYNKAAKQANKGLPVWSPKTLHDLGA